MKALVATAVVWLETVVDVGWCACPGCLAAVARARRRALSGGVTA